MQLWSYISGRSSLLCTLFFVAAFLEFIKLTQGRASAGRWLAVLALFALALFSKSIAVCFPLVIGLYLVAGSRRYNPWGTVIVAAVLDAVYVVWSRGLIGKAMLDPVRDLTVHWATQFKAVPFYTAIAALPVRLSVEHQFFAAGVWDLTVVFSAAVLGAVVVSAWHLRHKLSTEVFGIGWTVITIIPSAIVPLNVLVNEHRLYLPMVGAVLAIAALTRHSGRARYVLVAAIVALGSLTVARNRVWESEEILWADAVRKGPGMARPYVNLGKALLEDPQGQRLQASIDASRKALLINPILPRAHYNIGVAYLRRTERELAIASFERALTMAPEMMEAHMNHGVALKELGRYAEAQVSFRRALAIADFPEVHHNLGSTFLAALQADSAAVHFRAALNRDPDKRIAYEGLAKSLRFEGRHRQQALEVLTAALMRWPRDTDLLLLKGDVQAEMGQEEHAAQAYRTANLDEVRVRLRLGVAARKRGDWDGARRHYEAAERHSGSDPRIANAIGEVQLYEGRTQEALASFRRAARLDSEFSAAYLNIGLANLKHDGRALEAAAALEKAAALSPQSGKVLGLLGWAYDQQGDAEAAISAYSRAIALAPENAQQYHRLGMVYQNQGIWSEAKRLYEAALSRDGALAQTHFNLGFVYLEQGRFELAVEENERVLELDPDNADAHVNMASAWLGLSDHERAVVAFEHALALMDENEPRRAAVVTRLALLKASATQYER